MNTFSLSRFAMLLKVDLYENWRGLALHLLGVVAIATAIVWIAVERNRFAEIHQPLFVATFIMMGFYLSAAAFWQHRQASTRVAYLQIPASTLEKLAAKFVLIVPAYIVATFALYAVFALVVNWVFGLFGIWRIDGFELFTFNQRIAVAVLLCYQGLLVLGSMIFSRFALLKTLLCVVGVKFTLFAFGYLIVRIVFADHFDGFEVVNSLPIAAWLDENRALVESVNEVLVYLIAIGSWIAAYFVLKRRGV